MPTRLEIIAEQRREKLARLRALGIDPYPRRYDRSHTTIEAVKQLQKLESLSPEEKAAAERAEEDHVAVAGRIMAVRRMGRSAFADLRDGSGKIQLLFQDIHKLPDNQRELFDELDIGDIIGAEGILGRTKTSEPTVWVGYFQMLAKSLQPLPDKWHGLSDVDTRYRQRYIDLIANPEVKQVFQARSRTISAIRQFLDGRSFHCRDALRRFGQHYPGRYQSETCLPFH